jgi:3-keto-5-aminohexanoate cleavage enzyme
LNPELISLDCGSKNFGKLTFLCDEDFIETAARKALERGARPELEIFELGMIETFKRLTRQNLLQKPYYCGFILGTASGAPANIKTLVTMIDLLPPDCIWFVAGIGRHQLPMNLLALPLGGHVRVGLEDNIYYAQSSENWIFAKSNAELVSRIVRIAREVGREIATPEETRKMLQLPV